MVIELPGKPSSHTMHLRELPVAVPQQQSMSYRRYAIAAEHELPVAMPQQQRMSYQSLCHSSSARVTSRRVTAAAHELPVAVSQKQRMSYQPLCHRSSA